MLSIAFDIELDLHTAPATKIHLTSVGAHLVELASRSGRCPKNAPHLQFFTCCTEPAGVGSRLGPSQSLTSVLGSALLPSSPQAHTPFQYTGRGLPLSQRRHWRDSRHRFDTSNGSHRIASRSLQRQMMLASTRQS